MSTYLLRKGRSSEDAFTGMLADLVAWWPERAVALLAGARKFDEATGSVGLPRGINPRHEGDILVSPWPSWPSGEPDLILEFRPPNGNRSLVIIEAKLGAAKSSVDDAANGPLEPRDQLAKYWWDATAGRDRPGTPLPTLVEVLYLTHHPTAPLDDLASSMAAMKRMNQSQSPALYWLGWSDIERSLRMDLRGAGAQGALARAFRSAAEVLARADLVAFAGAWRPEGLATITIPASGWRFRRSWRPPRPLPVLTDPIFWRKHGR